MGSIHEHNVSPLSMRALAARQHQSIASSVNLDHRAVAAYTADTAAQAAYTAVAVRAKHCHHTLHGLPAQHGSIDKLGLCSIGKQPNNTHAGNVDTSSCAQARSVVERAARGCRRIHSHTLGVKQIKHSHADRGERILRGRAKHSQRHSADVLGSAGCLTARLWRRR